MTHTENVAETVSAWKPPQIGDDADGTVLRWVDEGYGFGFVEVPGFPQDVFVSARCLLNAADLRRGDRVTGEVRMDGRGRLFLDNVTLLDGGMR